jgi:fructose-bisphosphate aldolase, class II
VLDEAAKGGYGVGAFNANNLEQVQGIVTAAQCFEAIELGFTSVMMDGSLLADGKTPSDYGYKVEVTRRVVEAAHTKGVSVEGELGTLGGIADGHGSGEVHLTDPGQAVDFVDKTGVDALAVATGTSHGAYKFTSKPTGDVLAMHLIEEIHQKLPDTHMVMDGSSSVPQELVDRINAAGGELVSTFGVPVEEIQQGIRHSVRKINVDTDGRLAITAAMRETMNANPSEFDPRAFFKPAREAQKQVAAERLTQFGAAGHEGDYEVLSLAEMGERYRKKPVGA